VSRELYLLFKYFLNPYLIKNLILVVRVRLLKMLSFHGRPQGSARGGRLLPPCRQIVYFCPSPPPSPGNFLPSPGKKSVVSFYFISKFKTSERLKN